MGVLDEHFYLSIGPVIKRQNKRHYQFQLCCFISDEQTFIERNEESAAAALLFQLISHFNQCNSNV